ncbi:hypothetical protein MMC34_007068 [Xylographa carneopallida]|nr:hypothetical protein [Xylographa carneopallida]
MSTTNDVLRPVGMFEKLYTARQVLGIYNSVVVTATCTVYRKLENGPLYSIFCIAISRLLCQHGSLNCYVEGVDTSEPRFQRLNTIEIQDVLQIEDLEKGDSLAQKLQFLHDQSWSVDRKPLWKLVVMREPRVAGDTAVGLTLHIAFVYHHVIGDGLSGAAFHASLIRELESIEKTGQHPQESPTAIDTPPSINLIEPIEKLTPLPLSWSFLIKQVVQEYAPRSLIGAPSPLWTGLPVQTLDKCPLRSRVQIVTIRRDRVESLLQECRKHGVTITSLLSATIVTILAKALPEAPRFLGWTAYTLRRATGTSMNDIVNQTSSFETNYPADSLDSIRKASNITERVESLWSTATCFHAQMQDELARCPRDNPVGLLPYVSDHVKYYQKKFGKAREATWELSNLGVFKKIPDSLPGVWTLEGMTFTQGAQPVGPAFTVNCASVQDGPLTMAITWQDSVVHQEIIDALAHGFTDLPYFLETKGPV